MSEKKFTITITQNQAGKRIDTLCSELYPEFSRTYFSKHAAFIRDGIETTYKKKTKKDETWDITIDLTKTWNPEELTPWDHPLTILAESDTWAAIEKPIGISVHPSPSDPEQKTIINALLHHFGKNLSDNEGKLDGFVFQRPGLVHRLDKGTSGILLIAKTNETHRYFQEHWHTKVRKFYTAIVEGTPSEDEGIIDGPLARDPKDKTKMKVRNVLKAKEAKTHFWLEESNYVHSMLNVELYTGRTHQIRAHLSSIQLPILGDTKYGGSEAERMFLHARELMIPDPDNNGAEVTILSPVPKIFKTKTKDLE